MVVHSMLRRIAGMKGGCVRILVVDDHFAVGEALGLALSTRHTVVDVLFNGHDLLPRLAQSAVDAILLDTTLPDCNLRKMIRVVRREYPGTLILAMSIHDDHGDWPDLHRSGAHGVVSKTRPLIDVLVLLEVLEARRVPCADEEEEILNPALTSRQIDVLERIAADRLRKKWPLTSA